MPLRNKAYLVLETSEMGEGVFELESAEESGDFDRQLVIGNRGQFLQGVSDLAPVAPSFGEEGAGYNVDLNSGTDVWTLDFEVVRDSTGSAPRWGNGSTGTSREDAQGAHPQTQIQVLRYWVRTARTDSENPARLYYGDWSTGRFAASSGVFDAPIPVVVNSVTPRWERDDPSAAKGTVELLRTDEMPDFSGDDIPLIGDLLDDQSG